MSEPAYRPSERLARLERTPLRPLVRGARGLWRRAFALRCRWLDHRMFRERAALVLTSPDWAHIEKVADAGKVRGDTQVMHNGLLVLKGSYYGAASVPLLRKTQGVHEPQEERVFAAVLPLMPVGAVMVELGSYWAFYSMWFAKAVPDARCFMVEPEPGNLEFGRANFELNGLRGEFHRALVGAEPSPTTDGGAPTISVDSFCEERGIGRIHLLHADIQGFEMQMLRGAKQMLAGERIDFLFISTHGEALHAECRGHLAGMALTILADVAPRQSYSVDGLIVAARGVLSRPPSVSLSLRPEQRGTR